MIVLYSTKIKYMTPYLKEVIDAGCELFDAVKNQLNFFEHNKAFIQHLIDEQLLRGIEVTSEGLVFSPLSALDLARVLAEHYGWTFSRERDGTLYKWVTTSNEFNCQIIIEANENIDMTGTVVTFTSPKH